jgi:hypothetical protein
MQLHPRVDEITAALYKRHTHLAKGTDDQRRELTKMIAEQVVFEFPNAEFGWKSAEKGRPPSKDAIAQKQPTGRIFAWDLFNGTTREPIPGGLWHDITTQHFIEVEPVDHLGVRDEDVHDGPIEDIDEDDLEDELVPVMSALDELHQKADALSSHLTAISRKQNDQDAKLDAILAKLEKGFTGEAKGGWPLGTVRISIK